MTTKNQEALERFRKKFKTRRDCSGGKLHNPHCVFNGYKGCSDIVVEDVEILKEFIDEELTRAREEELESLKYNIIGLFPINRIGRHSQESIIELLHTFIDRKISGLKQKPPDKIRREQDD